MSRNSISLHLHFYRYDSAAIKQVFDIAKVNKTPHPIKNIILSVHEPRIPQHMMSGFKYHKKITDLVAANTSVGDILNNLTVIISDSILQDDLKDICKGCDKGQLYIQLERILKPTSFKDKLIEMLFVLSDLAENNTFYINYNRQPVLESINISENMFIQRHKGQNVSVAVFSLTDSEASSIASIIPIDHIYKFNSFYIKLLDQKLELVEFTNYLFPIDLTIAVYFKPTKTKRVNRKRKL